MLFQERFGFLRLPLGRELLLGNDGYLFVLVVAGGVAGHSEIGGTTFAIDQRLLEPLCFCQALLLVVNGVGAFVFVKPLYVSVCALVFLLCKEDATTAALCHQCLDVVVWEPAQPHQRMCLGVPLLLPVCVCWQDL